MTFEHSLPAAVTYALSLLYPCCCCSALQPRTSTMANGVYSLQAPVQVGVYNPIHASEPRKSPGPRSNKRDEDDGAIPPLATRLPSPGCTALSTAQSRVKRLQGVAVRRGRRHRSSCPVACAAPPLPPPPTLYHARVSARVLNFRHARNRHRVVSLLSLRVQTCATDHAGGNGGATAGGALAAAS